jgi:two-component system CheB/CheR fusion protein
MDAIENAHVDSEETAAPSFLVVGIGASAGGLEALERFFDSLPQRTTGMAFVVVQHLSPDFKSLMDELLSRHTSLPIALAEEGMQVEPDHVYLLPPKKELIISAGRLMLSERQQELSLPIDVFFRSLARDCGQRAVAIVLSGGGSDGSRGARDVRERGGLVLVQDVDSAQFGGMPKTALDAGVADWVLEPSQMPEVLLRRAREYSDTPLLARSGRSASQPQGIDAVYRMLQEQFGIDFTHYKPSTVTRRIERRVALAHSADINEYVDRLRNQHDELDVLYRDLLIGVTRFFRDPKVFELLEQKVLPQLLLDRPETPLRVWVAGCATGEEAYSFAIALQELMFKLNMPNRQVKIFATDVHRGSLERAARALYDAEAVANVSADRLERYFVRVGSSYQVIPDLRQMIVFAAHNLIKDAPFTRVDLISCRNLLIYLQPPAQHRALSLFHFALNRNGALILGSSESPGSLLSDFETVDKHWRIYRRLTERPLTIDARVAAPQRTAPAHTLSQIESTGRYSLTQLLGTYDALLDQVVPPSLLVSERGELIHAFNGGSRLLQLRDGRQGLDVLDLVTPELKMILVGGLKRTLSEGGPVVFKGVRIGAGGDEPPQRLTMRRILSRGGGPRHVLITCEAMQGEHDGRAHEHEFDLEQISREQLSTLEAELNHTKESLQAAIEELETSNEELQASNEELQASNEELQSTNEELQSVNEELYTVNSEYQRKIAELTELTNDMDNLLSSTDVGTVFLDNQLRIRRFTPRIADTFSLVAHDIGRSIQTFAHRLDHPELLDDLKRVSDTGQPIERELRGPDGQAFFLRVLPYRTRGAVDGVVLTLIDVTGLKTAEDELFHERYLLNSLLATVPDAISFKDKSGRFIRANRAMGERLGVAEARDLIGKVPFEVPNRELALQMHETDQAVLQSGETQHYKLEHRVGSDGKDDWDLVTRLPLRDAETRLVGVIAIFRSVTEQKLAEQKIQEAVRRRDQFLAMLSHELRNPLGAIVTATALLKSDHDQRTRDYKLHTRLLDVLERQSQQMAHLLDDLLEASRVTQNKIELRCRVVDLRVAVREAIDAERTRMNARALTFTTDVSHAPLWVNGDPTRLQQIHVNLLSNAAKYTPSGGAVHIDVKREGDEAVVTVKDNGAGIAGDMLESVFELFVQSHLTLDRSAGGLGVGLTLARSLVTLHGGRICAHSDGEGQGSEFEVRLPLVAAPDAEQSVETTLRGGRTAAGTKVVVVEDSEDSRDLLCMFLRRAGFECHTADNGTAALALIERERPDIAILDVGLPEMDGFEVARRLRQHPMLRDTVLIALTGYGRASDRATSRAAGFDEHLVKPVRIEQLLAVLGQAREAGGRDNVGEVAGG